MQDLVLGGRFWSLGFSVFPRSGPICCNRRCCINTGAKKGPGLRE